MIVETTELDQLRPLFERYMHHMKQYFKIDNEQDWFDQAYKYLSLYISEVDRNVFLISNDDETTGFALVNRITRFKTCGSAIAEFYIVPEAHGKGYGRVLAESVFTQQPGIWEVCVASPNIAAFNFWKRVINEYTLSNYSVKTKETYDGHGFLFCN